MLKKNFFFNKTFLIYGFGLSGKSAFEFLKKNNTCIIYDDNKKKISEKYNNFLIKKTKLNKVKFNYIIISPGINIEKCKLKNFIKKNYSKIITELDIFQFCYPSIKKVAITGTNGKSTTSKIIHEACLESKIDARLTGNIGRSILREKEITKKTLFIIEVSSYQSQYSKYFQSDYSLIINISPDHLERHRTFSKYVDAKIKIILNQKKNDVSIIDNDRYLIDRIKKNKLNSNLITLKYSKYNKFKKKITNKYFSLNANFKNLCFLFEISKYLKLKNKNIFKAVNRFEPLKYRQQLVYDNQYLKIINDSKSTSYASSIPLLENQNKIFWILGGTAKKGDKFLLNKKYYKNINAYIFGKDKNFFFKSLNKKIKFKYKKNLDDILDLLFFDLKKLNKKNSKKITILFSPAAASFDQYENFEKRGQNFNFLIKKKIKLHEQIF